MRPATTPSLPVRSATTAPTARLVSRATTTTSPTTSAVPAPTPSSPALPAPPPPPAWSATTATTSNQTTPASPAWLSTPAAWPATALSAISVTWTTSSTVETAAPVRFLPACDASTALFACTAQRATTWRRGDCPVLPATIAALFAGTVLPTVLPAQGDTTSPATPAWPALLIVCSAPTGRPAWIADWATTATAGHASCA